MHGNKSGDSKRMDCSAKALREQQLHAEYLRHRKAISGADSGSLAAKHTRDMLQSRVSEIEAELFSGPPTGNPHGTNPAV